MALLSSSRPGTHSKKHRHHRMEHDHFDIFVMVVPAMDVIMLTTVEREFAWIKMENHILWATTDIVLDEQRHVPREWNQTCGQHFDQS